MKTLVARALMLALLCAPSVALAGADLETPDATRAPSSPDGAAPASEAGDYAAREAAAPALAEFQGGMRDEYGHYIGASALVVALLVILIILLVL